MNRTRRSMPSAVSGLAVLLLASAASAQPASRLPAGLAQWKLSAQPILRIGSESDTTMQFLRVSARRMPAGEIAVMNSATAELRIFSPRGAFVRSLSRRGQGPGEFENPSSVYRAGDTLYVVEFAPNATRMSSFTLADGFLKRIPVRAGNVPEGIALRARLSTGDFLVSRGSFKALDPVLNMMKRDTTIFGIVRVAEPPAPVTFIGAFPDNTFFSFPSPAMRGGVGYSLFPLAPMLATGASGDRAWLGDTGTGLLSIFDATGKRVTQAQLPVRPRAFVDAALARARERAVASATSGIQTERWENIYDRKVRPRTAPLFTRLIPAPDGQMAVELYEEEERAVPRSVLVLDRNGKAVAGFVGPANVVIQEIGADYLLGVHFDDEGVEQVVMYSLQR